MQAIYGHNIVESILASTVTFDKARLKPTLQLITGYTSYVYIVLSMTAQKRDALLRLHIGSRLSKNMR